MLNLRGFEQFVDAIGGITVNVAERLPIGGNSENRVATGWIAPGKNRHLDGYHALWYARSRWSTSDYDRMRRQRCVIGAVVGQADPVAVALNFDKIARAAKDNISTDIPLTDIDAWVTLTLRIKKAHVRSLAFTDAVINTSDPNFPKIRQLVRTALEAPAAGPTSPPSPTPTRTGKQRTPRPSASPSGDQTQAQDVNAVC
jgi:anionic cell wall polymer biosynthesis LytR-Cps2A-Psr (LCP) family protein